MSKRIFITGDRAAFPPAVLPLIAITMLREKDAEIYTGDLTGVEEGVQFLAGAADMPLEIVHSPMLETGKPDFEQRAKNLCELGFDEILVIHGDPHVSKIYKSMIDLPALADKVKLVAPELLLS